MKKIIVAACIAFVSVINGLAKIEIPPDIEVIARFIAFPKDKIDELTKEDLTTPLTVETLSSLLKQGTGRIIASPRVVAIAGNESVIFSGETQGILLDCSTHANPSSMTNTNCIVVCAPQDFETFPMGATLKFTAIISDDGGTIYIDLHSRLSIAPEWKSSPAKRVSSDSKEGALNNELPRIKQFRCSTQLSMRNGETAIVSGGMVDRKENEVIFVFVTCTIVHREKVEEDPKK